MILVIAILKSITKNGKRDKITGVRLLCADTMRVKDVEIGLFIQRLRDGVVVDNIRLNDKCEFEPVNLDMSKMPIIYNIERFSTNMYKSFIIPVENDEYKLVDYMGRSAIKDSDTIKAKIAEGRIANPDYYVVTAQEEAVRNKLIKKYESMGYTRVVISDGLVLESAEAPVDADLFIDDSLTDIKREAIHSASGRFNHIVMSRMVGSTPEVLRLHLTKIIDVPANSTLSINKITLCDSNYIKDILGLELVGKTTVELDFDLNEDAEYTMREITGYNTNTLPFIVAEGKIDIEIKDGNRLGIKRAENLYKMLEERIGLKSRLSKCYNLYDVGQMIRIDGSKTEVVVKSLAYLEGMKPLMTTELYDYGMSIVRNNNMTIQSIIKDEAIERYSEYDATIIRKKGINVLCSRVVLSNKQLNDGARDLTATYVNSDKCKKEVGYYDNVEYDMVVANWDIKYKYIVLGVNREFKDEPTYCLIKLRPNKENYVNYFSGLVNMGIVELMSLIETPGSGLANIQTLDAGDYYILQSASDIVTVNKSIIRDKIEASKTDQLLKLELKNELLGVESDYFITAFGVLTKVSNDDGRIVKIPPVVKEIEPMALKSWLYDYIEIPSGVKTIKESIFEHNNVSIGKIAVNDHRNAIGVLAMLGRSWNSTCKKKLDVGTLLYKPINQADLYRFLLRAWDRDDFYWTRLAIEFDMRLDLDNTIKLMSSLCDLSGYTEIMGCVDDGDFLGEEDLRNIHKYKLDKFRGSFTRMDGALDKDAMRVIKTNIYQNLY